MNRASGTCATLGLLLISVVFAAAMGHATIVAAESDDQWLALFDGRSLDGWQAAEHRETWQVKDGCLVARGDRSDLCYLGSVGHHEFRNFELEAEVRTEPAAGCGIVFHTPCQSTGLIHSGYEVQVSNAPLGTSAGQLASRTGSLLDVRHIWKPCVTNDEWFRIRLCVVGNRVRIWVNDLPTVDYVQPNQPFRRPENSAVALSRGTIVLRKSDPGGQVAFRAVKIRLLPDDADPLATERASADGYGLQENLMDRFAQSGFPVIDYHVHLRGGMTVQKAIDRQAVTGVNCGVLRNIGKGWEMETDDQLREFLASVERKPLFVGVQVNDRDWMHGHAGAAGATGLRLGRHHDHAHAR